MPKVEIESFGIIQNSHDSTQHLSFWQHSTKNVKTSYEHHTVMASVSGWQMFACYFDLNLTTNKKLIHKADKMRTSSVERMSNDTWL